MERELIIKLGLDRTQAEASAEKFAEGEKGRQQELVASARAAEAAKTRAAEASGRERMRTIDRTAVAEQRSIRDTSEARSRAMAAARDELGRFTKEGSEGLEKTTQAAGGLALGFQGIATGAVVLSAINRTAAVLVNILKDANAETQKQIDKLAQSKDLIREISMIRGSKEGPSDAELTRFMEVRKASGLSAEEARENVLEFEGSAASSKGVNISDAEYERLKPLQAKVAATAGGGPGAAGTFGKLSGMLLSLREYKTAEDVVAAEVQFNRILSRGVGDNPTLIKQAAQVAGAYVAENGRGIAGNENELAAMTATATKIDPNTAAEVMKSTTRVLRGFGEKWSPMLKDAGITEKDSYVGASNKLYAKLEEVEKSGRSVDAFLSEQGVDQHGSVNLMSMYRYRKFLNDTMADESQRMTGKEAMAEIDEKYRTDVSLRTKLQEARLDAAELGNAMPRQFFRERELEARANISLRGEGVENAAAKADDYRTGLAAMPFGNSDPEALGRKMREEREMFRLSQERGLEVPNRPNDTSLFGGTPFAYTNWVASGAYVDAYSSVGTEMEMSARVGGNPRANKNVDWHQQEDKSIPVLQGILEGINKLVGGQDKKPAPPIQSRPVVQTR